VRKSALKAAAGAAIFLIGARQARTRQVTELDERIFWTVDGLPNAVQVPGWVVMQAGSLGAVIAAATGAAAAQRHGTAIRLAIAGGSMWIGAKATKHFIGRGRPADHLEGVAIRGRKQSGLGYPSGHAAVSASLAVVASRTWPRASLALGAVAAVTAVMRVYDGAHFPSDVLGGAAAGVAAGVAVNGALGAGRPASHVHRGRW
jgi:undecaprenyl-diphosphatase